MSKSTLYAEALMGTYENFLEKFKEGDQYKIDDNGENLLWTAMSNSGIERYKMVTFLIQKGSDVKILSKNGSSLFLPLFTKGRTNIELTTQLCRLFIEKGVDITVLYKPDNTVMFKYLLTWVQVSEQELIPIYDLIFSQKGLKLLTKDKYGFTPLEFAKKNNDRNIVVKYMEDYIKKYNLKEEN